MRLGYWCGERGDWPRFFSGIFAMETDGKLARPQRRRKVFGAIRKTVRGGLSGPSIVAKGWDPKQGGGTKIIFFYDQGGSQAVPILGPPLHSQGEHRLSQAKNRGAKRFPSKEVCKNFSGKNQRAIVAGPPNMNFRTSIARWRQKASQKKGAIEG